MLNFRHRSFQYLNINLLYSVIIDVPIRIIKIWTLSKLAADKILKSINRHTKMNRIRIKHKTNHRPENLNTVLKI